LCYSSLVVAQEIVSNEKRSLFSSIINIGYSLCGILYSIAFYYVQDWRIVFYILTGASFLTLILIWAFIYDSPRRYINKKNYRKTIKILEGIASFNGKLDEFRNSIRQDEYQEIMSEIKGEEPLKVKDNEKGENEQKNENEQKEIDEKMEKENLKEKDEEEEKKEKEEKEENKVKQEEKKEKENEVNVENKNSDMLESLVSEDKNVEDSKITKSRSKIHKITFWSIFKYPSIRYKFVILNFLWIGTRASFNGISISSKSFPGNFYVNIIILYIIESISYSISGYLIDIRKLGRKGTLWLEYTLVIITFLLLGFLKLDTMTSLGLNFIARFCAAGIEVIFYTYTIELYPTPVRSIAFGVNATFGNGGSILAPLLLEFLPYWFFLLLFAIINALNAFFIVFLPETVGKPMSETIEEMEKEEEEIKEEEQ
jgi:predicted MFS family arabinose efflux permease